jgi:NADH-quinone oxidoreductase subunit J
MITALAFYMFASILVISALMVITARNPVHSVLFLILGFFNAAGLFILLGAEFLAMIMVIVYVGAVAVLFLFVVMMLDIDFRHLRKGAMQYVPLGILIGAVLMLEFVTLFGAWQFADGAMVNIANPTPENITNTEALGALIYTDYFLPFQVSGLILLVSMIGAIVLTLRQRPGVRKQKVAEQFERTVEESMEVKKVSSGSGI